MKTKCKHKTIYWVAAFAGKVGWYLLEICDDCGAPFVQSALREHEPFSKSKPETKGAPKLVKRVM